MPAFLRVFFVPGILFLHCFSYLSSGHFSLQLGVVAIPTERTPSEHFVRL